MPVQVHHNGICPYRGAGAENDPDAIVLFHHLVGIVQSAVEAFVLFGEFQQFKFAGAGGADFLAVTVPEHIFLVQFEQVKSRRMGL